MLEEPRCYTCGAPISTSDSTPWNIKVVFRDALNNVFHYSFTVLDDSHMALDFLNGMYRRGFFAREEPDRSLLHVIPISRVVEVIVTPGADTHANH